MHPYDAAIKDLTEARRIARTIPGADISNDLDSLLRSVYIWTESGGRHVKLYECGVQARAIELSKRVRDFLGGYGVLGSSQLYSEGRIFVDFWDKASSTLGLEIDKLYDAIMAAGA